MKISMKEPETFAKWFLITCASSDENTHEDKNSKFNQMINHPEWNSEDIKLSVVINGFEFSNLEDVFKRVEDHIQEKIEKALEKEPFNSLRIERIQDILNASNKEDLEYC